MGTSAMWTTERPVPNPSPELPSFVLLSGEGQVVLSGATKEHLREIDDRIEQLVKSKSRPPKDLPRDLGKAWVECNEGNFAKAHEIASKAKAESGEDGIKREAAERILETVRQRLDSRFKRIRWMLDNGYPIEAGEMTEELKKGVKGLLEREELIAKIEAELATEEMKVEIAAEKELARIEKKLFEEPEVRFVKQLQKLIEKYPNTKTALRASKLAKVAAI
jgi:hypothetical protein